ncbi:MAG: Franean1_4349 family RiPP [Chloroflexota bacterium]
MASTEQIQNIIGEAITNEEFRSRLIEDPAAAVREYGYELSEDQVNQLVNLDKEEIEGLLSDVEERLSKAGSPSAVVSVGVSWP